MKEQKIIQRNKTFNESSLSSKTITVFSLFFLSALLGFLFFNFSIGLNNLITGNAVSQDIYRPQAFIEGISDVFIKIIDLILPNVEIFFGPTSSQTFLPKIIFMILIFLFIWWVLGTVQIQNVNLNGFGLKFFLSLLFGLLFTRWLARDELILLVMAPYNAVGAALSAFIPIVFAFYTLNILLKKRRHVILRKVGWIMIMSYFITFYFVAYRDIKNMENPEFIWVYPIAAVLCLLMVIFDKSLSYYLLSEEAQQSRELQNKEMEKIYRRQIVQITKDIENHVISRPEDIKDATNQIKLLNKYILDLYKP